MSLLAFAHQVSHSDLVHVTMIVDSFACCDPWNPLGRKLLEMGNYSECVCDSARTDIINCDGRRVHLEVRYLETFSDVIITIAMSV